LTATTRGKPHYGKTPSIDSISSDELEDLSKAFWLSFLLRKKGGVLEKPVEENYKKAKVGKSPRGVNQTRSRESSRQKNMGSLPLGYCIGG